MPAAPTAFEPTFVGDDRRALLGDLIATHERVVARGESRLVVFSAPTGWGKTRIVRELYGHLARAGGGDYWPPRLDAGEGSWLQARKRVFPAPFDVSEEAEIPYLWLGVSCQKDQMGRELSALQYAEQQFQAHVGPLAAALEGRGDRWKTRLGAAGAIAGLFGLPDPVQLAMTWHGVATSGWELVTGEWKSFRDRGAGKKARRVETHGGEDVAERAAELAEQMARLSGEDLPIVLAIDDAHWADPGTVAFIGKLLNTEGHVLLVATAWPDQLAIQETEVGTFGNALGAWLEAGRAERHDLERLPDRALAGLLEGAAEDIEPRLLRALCERADGNPNRLQGLLSLRIVRRALASGGGGLTEEQIEALPAGDAEIIMAIWRDLPEHVRDVLALSTLQGSEFNPDWIPAAAELLDLADADTGLAQARSPWGWVRSLDAALAAFVEAGLYERAEAESRTLFLPDELARARGAMLRWAVEQKRRSGWASLSAPARRAVLEAHFLGADQGFLEIDEDVVDSTRQLVELLEDGEELDRWAEVAGRGIEWTAGKPALEEQWWTFRANEADAIAAKGLVAEALDRYRSLVREHGKATDASADAHLEMRYRLSWLLVLAEETEEALAEAERVLQVWTGRYGDRDEKTLRARRRRAMVLARMRETDEALAELEAVIEGLAETRPPDDPDILLVRAWRANALGDARRVGKAIEELKEILEVETRRLGRDHPRTLWVRHQLGHWLLGSRRTREEARDTLEALYADRLQILGPDHPSTLATRGNLAVAYSHLEDWDRAIEIERELLERKERALGPDQLTTIATLDNLEFSLRESGRWEEAVDVARRLLSARQRVSGDDHPHTVRTRLRLGRGLRELGETEEAIAIHTIVADEAPGAFGWTYHLTHQVHVELAEMLRDVGRPDEGRGHLARFRDRLADRFGDTHWDTLAARRELAAWDLDTARLRRDPAGVREAVASFDALIGAHEALPEPRSHLVKKALNEGMEALRADGWDPESGAFNAS